VIDPTERFAELVSGGEEQLRLDEAMLAIAAHATAALDVAAQLARLDALAASCPSATVPALATHLFLTEGFRGNVEDYYDPSNSLLDRVLDRRLGIPISLSVLAIEVGRRIDVPLLGVGMPGHFLVRSAVDADLFVDPFGGGAVLDVEGCRQIFHAVMGQQPIWDASLLEPIGAFALLSRVLNNLQRTYTERGDTDAVAWVLRLQSFLPGTIVTERSSALRRAARWN
jgi:regulator of sirC expression with transglutaminase-like and TPR domain